MKKITALAVITATTIFGGVVAATPSQATTCSTFTRGTYMYGHCSDGTTFNGRTDRWGFSSGVDSRGGTWFSRGNGSSQMGTYLDRNGSPSTYSCYGSRKYQSCNFLP